MAENKRDVSSVCDIASEVSLVGCLYKDINLFLEFEDVFRSKYDFSDEATRFYFDALVVMVKTFSSTTEQAQVDAFMLSDEERYVQYKRFGGYSFISHAMELCVTDDFENYLNTVKKFALCREYTNKGIDMTRVMSWRKFDLMTADQVAEFVQSEADRVFTNICVNKKAEVFNTGMVDFVRELALKPEMGVEIPFNIIHEAFRGYSLGKAWCTGMISNAGKSRIMCYLVADLAFLKKKRVAVLLNEMDLKDIRAALFSVVINNKQFKKAHGIDFNKPEKEVVLGLYRDDKTGAFIEREFDEWGDFIESEEDYLQRLYDNSQEFRNIQAIAEWIERQIDQQIFVRVMNDYSDQAIMLEIKRYKMTRNVDYFFYDTLKGFKTEDWSQIKQTATALKELATKLGVFIYCSIQMTDDSQYVPVEQLNSNQIASCKGLKHVVDHLILAKRIDAQDYKKYRYIPINDEWGKDPRPLDPSKVYYGLKIDKNRRGSKDMIPLLQVDLDGNIWEEVGLLVTS